MSYIFTKAQYPPSARFQKNRGRGLSKTGFKIIILSIVFAFVSMSLIIWNKWERPLASPLSPITNFRFFLNLWPKGKSESLVYGFLPYWNLKEIKIEPKLSHLAYFGLTLGADGSLRTQGDSESLAGYRGLQSEDFLILLEKLNADDIKLDLVIKQFVLKDTESFLSSNEAQENFFNQLDSLILSYPVSGINLDIEVNNISTGMQEKFTNFVSNLKTHLLSKNQKIALSIDVYASAAQGNQIWNIAALEPYVDYFVVMAYDFHQSSSPQAGPVSPLIAAGKTQKSNIIKHLREFLEQAPAEKILLGVPFYGYQWQTISRDKSANTYPETGQTASYQQVKNILSQKKVLQVEERWDDEFLVPYLSYQKDEQTFIIYYEDSRSLGYKIDYVNQLGLAGIAIWALGYEGDSNELWQVINDKL